MLLGLSIGAFLLYLAHAFGLARFYALAVLTLLAGAAASLGSAACFLTLGVGALISGWLTLWRYLKSTRPLAGS